MGPQQKETEDTSSKLGVGRNGRVFLNSHPEERLTLLKNVEVRDNQITKDDTSRVRFNTCQTDTSKSNHNKTFQVRLFLFLTSHSSTHCDRKSS